MDYNVIFVAGPQGSGKGTQGKRLAEKLGFLFWEMGGTLRRILASDSPLGKKLSAMERGALLSDELIIEVLQDQLPLIPHEKGIVFDGVPRRLGQGQFLVEYCKSHGMDKMATIFIDVPREECVRRLLLRARNESRTDDTSEAIAQRFRDYDEAIKAPMDYLRTQTTFITIDGTPAPDVIAANINKALGIDE
ncbi:MAG TPA: nucleoside monophosphate kinase [Candidatus Paceibacterota bacterium]